MIYLLRRLAIASLYRAHRREMRAQWGPLRGE